MMQMNVVRAIKEATGKRPCDASIRWLEAGGYTDLATAWQECPRADWLLWFAIETALGELNSDARKRLVLAACDDAELGLAYIPEDEHRPRKAIEMARAWCWGETTKAEVRDAVLAAGWAAHAAFEADADWAVDASNAAWAAAWVLGEEGIPGIPEGIIDHGPDVQEDDDDDFNEEDVLRADLVRRHYPVPPIPDGPR